MSAAFPLSFPHPRSQEGARLSNRDMPVMLSGPAEEVFTSMHETAVAVQDHAETRGGRRAVDRPVHVEVSGESHMSSCVHRLGFTVLGAVFSR